MSGLAAIFRRDNGPVGERDVAKMLEAVPYRGADGQLSKSFGRAALGYAKLTITEEDVADRQPVSSPRSGWALVGDVRLDNRRELLARLSDPPRGSASDAEVMLGCLEARGLDVISDFIGDFAFVAWDSRNERMIAARDTSGQRTLYYRCDSRVFAAASEIHQLFQDSSVPIAPNEDAIRDFLTPTNVFHNRRDQANTFFAGIFAVPAGHALVATRDTIAVRPFWQLNSKQLRYRDEQDYFERFREILFEAVQARLRSIYPIGAFLSGGLDSSTVACVAQELYRQGRAEDRGFTTFSIVFEGLECDERDLIGDVQAKYGLNSKLLPASNRVQSLNLTPTGFLGGPTKASSETAPVVEAAYSSGIRVLLSGDVGDAAIFGSALAFDSLIRQLRLRELPRFLQLYRQWFGESWRKILVLHGLLPLLPVGVNRQIRSWYARRSHRRDPFGGIPYWLDDRVKEVVSRRELELRLLEERGRRFSSSSREADYRALFPPEVGHNYAGWPIQNFRPFADRRLHEFLLSIPPELKFRPHPSSDEHYAAAKRIVRESMRGILPESIRTRLKPTHFAAMFDQEIQREWSVYEAAFGPGTQAEVAQQGYVDGAKFWKRLNDLKFGLWGWDFLYIHRIMWLETWLRSLRQPRQQLVTVRSAAASVTAG